MTYTTYFITHAYIHNTHVMNIHAQVCCISYTTQFTYAQHMCATHGRYTDYTDVWGNINMTYMYKHMCIQYILSLYTIYCTYIHCMYVHCTHVYHRLQAHSTCAYIPHMYTTHVYAEHISTPHSAQQAAHTYVFHTLWDLA